MSVTANIIRDANLKPGDAMRNVHGETVEGSMVLDGSTFMYRDGDNPDGGYRLYSESPITGAVIDKWLPDTAIAAIRASTI